MNSFKSYLQAIHPLSDEDFNYGVRYFKRSILKKVISLSNKERSVIRLDSFYLALCVYSHRMKQEQNPQRVSVQRIK